jgi:hypothetical protein
MCAQEAQAAIEGASGCVNVGCCRILACLYLHDILLNPLFAVLSCLAAPSLWIGRFRRAQVAVGLPRAGASEFLLLLLANLFVVSKNPTVSSAEISQVAGMIQQNLIGHSNHIIHAPPSGPSYLPQTKAERLRELQSLFEEGAINEEELANGRAAIIRS